MNSYHVLVKSGISKYGTYTNGKVHTLKTTPNHSVFFASLVWWHFYQSPPNKQETNWSSWKD